MIFPRRRFGNEKETGAQYYVVQCKLLAGRVQSSSNALGLEACFALQQSDRNWMIEGTLRWTTKRIEDCKYGLDEQFDLSLYNKETQYTDAIKERGLINIH